MNAEIIIGLALMGVGAAVVAFLRTPAELRYKQPEPMKEAGAEYAEQYSRTERVRFILIGLALNGSLFLLWKFWALPRWADFANMSPCYELWGISGVTILFHALFVGIPLLSALAVTVLISRRGSRSCAMCRFLIKARRYSASRESSAGASPSSRDGGMYWLRCPS
ncbi:hypothetical protein ULF88_00980 [Halopseudomonas pachastrellae]|nr:hypothetical protein [Halopseudomonas pachastrellae]